MTNLTLKITNSNGEVLIENSEQHRVNLVYNGAYEKGDSITLNISDADIGCHLMVSLDDTMCESFVYMAKNSFTYAVPFDEKKVAFNPKSFGGEIHLLSARIAEQYEIDCYKNLCKNLCDCHQNDALFPHAYANVETRGESVFAASNAINGNVENHSHGPWPYESWGINQNPDAEIVIDFGRDVKVDTLVLITRADFPHDNWWTQGLITFSDGQTLTVDMEKSDKPHVFKIEPRVVRSIKLNHLIKDVNDPSPFPALTQLEAYGVEA